MTESVFTPVPEAEMPYFWLWEGVKCYIAMENMEDAVQSLEAQGITDFYVLSVQTKTVTTGNTTTTTRHPQVFAVTQTIAYRCIKPVEVGSLPLREMEKKAYFALPPIPNELLSTVDDFFRAVYRKHNSESIVLLTFDTTVTTDDGRYSSEGWGFLIPEQENDASHCDYEPQSVAGKYPEDTYIVGSIHSHPNMPAFASGTDHKDQADFNGIHITYGWSASKNNGATEYHIELQIDGETWEMKPENVFGDPEPRVLSAEVAEAIETRVKKKSYGTGTGTWTGSAGRTSSTTAGHGAYSSSSSTTKRSTRLAPVNGLPQGSPSYEDNTIVGRLTSEAEVSCPFCTQPLIEADRTKRKCTACHSWLAMPGESASDVLARRNSEGMYSWDIDASENPPKPIMVWERDVDPSGKSFVTEYLAKEPVSGK